MCLAESHVCPSTEVGLTCLPLAAESKTQLSCKCKAVKLVRHRDEIAYLRRSDTHYSYSNLEDSYATPYVSVSTKILTVPSILP